MAQLVDPNTGAVFGQVDHRLPAARWNHSDGLADRLTIIPYRGPPPPQMAVDLGVYRTTPAGPQRLLVAATPALNLGTVTPDRISRTLPPTPARYPSARP